MNKEISRRNFLKYLAGGTAAVTPAAAFLTSCKEKNAQGNPDGSSDMTMRVNHNTGDRVSLLGYGMMRLPELPEDTPTTRRRVPLTKR